MKRLLYLLIFSVLTLTLSSCLVLTDGGDGLTIRDARFETDFSLVDNNNQLQNYAVCDDLLTNIRYEFKFSGTVESFEWYLKGDSGSEAYRERVRVGSPGVSFDAATGTVRVERTLDRGSPTFMAPQGVGELQPTGITITPIAQVLGYSNLFVEILGFSQGYTVTFPGSKIAVIGNCRDF
jgi:hypothetical protein